MRFLSEEVCTRQDRDPLVHLLEDIQKTETKSMGREKEEAARDCFRKVSEQVGAKFS